MDESIPGAYPATPQGELEPTIAAPPAPTPRDHRHHHYHHHHDEHNKLHKPTDPRGHRHTDSGIGFIDPEPIPNANDVAHQPTSLSENFRPTETSEPQPTVFSAPQDQHIDSNQSFKEKKGAVHSEPDTQAKRNSPPPYWGALPKAQRGGIYNTVTGHGSAGDDHTQHHHLPLRSAPERAHVLGATTDYPRGGIYNSVAGHGSQDEESLRHSHQGGDAQPASLPGISEEVEGNHGLAAPDPRGANVDGGSLQDRAGNGGAAFLGVPPRTNVPANLDPVISETSPISSSPPRAFPLVAHPEGHREAHQAPQEAYQPPQDAHQASQEPDAVTRDALLASTAAAGVGAAVASEQRDKRNKLKKKDQSPMSGSRRHTKDTGAAVGQPAEWDTKGDRRSSDEGSASSDKKHHKVLGLFHRRKDSKGEKEKVSTEPRTAESERHSAHNKVNVATTTGKHKDFHRHDQQRESNHQRSGSEPSKPQRDTRDGARHMSLNETTAATVAESAGAFGVLYQKPEAAHETENLARNRPGESAPEPPARSSKRRSLTPPGSVAVNEMSTRYPPASETLNNTSPPETSNSSQRNAAKYAGAGAVAGIGASVFANDFERPAASGEAGPRSSMTSPCGGMTPYTFESPRDPPPTPAGAGKTKHSRKPASEPVSPRATHAMIAPGNYNTLASGTASGVKNPTKDISDGGVRDSPDYNVLSSGTTSGVKQSLSSDRAPSGHQSETTGSDAGRYNILSSGTASGVQQSLSSDRSPSAFQSEGADSDSGKYNILSSGTPSGVKIRSGGSWSSATNGNRSFAKDGEEKHDQIASETTPNNDMAVNREAPQRLQNEAQSAHHALVAAPMPSHSSKTPSHSSEMPPRSFEMPSGSTEMAHQMSPEVLPESYRASSHPAPTLDDASQPYSVEKGEHIAKRSPDPGPSADDFGALYTHKAGPSYGLDPPPRVMHTCENCGVENDISSEFTKENIAKLHKKQGSTGNWWQSAWTSV